jgi:mRNA interferase MazF
MGAFAAGSIVLVRFPFSDLSQSKLRPAVVLADAGREDWLLCQITSKPYSDPRALQIDEEDFGTGSLQLTSFARPSKLFTAHQSLITSQVGVLRDDSFTKITGAIIRLLQQKS